MNQQLDATHEIPPRTCECGYYTARASMQPKEGDLTACPKCGVALAFGPDLVLRPLTHDEVDSLPDDVAARLGALQRAAKASAEEAWSRGDYS